MKSNQSDTKQIKTNSTRKHQGRPRANRICGGLRGEYSQTASVALGGARLFAATNSEQTALSSRAMEQDYARYRAIHHARRK